MVSMVAIPVYIPNNSAQVFPFSLHLPKQFSCLPDDSHSNRCEVMPHCGFDLHFP